MIDGTIDDWNLLWRRRRAGSKEITGPVSMSGDRAVWSVVLLENVADPAAGAACERTER
jgi:hypothetical protein